MEAFTACLFLSGKGRNTKTTIGWPKTHINNHVEVTTNFPNTHPYGIDSKPLSPLVHFYHVMSSEDYYRNHAFIMHICNIVTSLHEFKQQFSHPNHRMKTFVKTYTMVHNIFLFLPFSFRNNGHYSYTLHAWITPHGYRTFFTPCLLYYSAVYVRNSLFPGALLVDIRLLHG